jgi:hypothetical protein
LAPAPPEASRPIAIPASVAHAATTGLECHAGHGLGFDSVGPVAAIGSIVELNIGHFLIGEAIFEGLLLRGLDAGRGQQQALFEDLDQYLKPRTSEFNRLWDAAAEREKRSRTMFAQEAIRPEEVWPEVQAMRAAVGSGRGHLPSAHSPSVLHVKIDGPLDEQRLHALRGVKPYVAGPDTDLQVEQVVRFGDLSADRIPRQDRSNVGA